MKITLENIGRKFNRDWIFQGIDYEFHTEQRYAVLGPNGSGKSTLLRVLASSLSPSAGRITYQKDNQTLLADTMYMHISIAAPYMELIEEFTLMEHIRFHFRHKKYLAGVDENVFIEKLGLGKSLQKQIRHFSSGMKQRVKLAFACYADTPVLLLDEPTTNLDEDAVVWYDRLVRETSPHRLLVVCSNREKEYAYCQHQLNVLDFKG